MTGTLTLREAQPSASRWDTSGTLELCTDSAMRCGCSEPSSNHCADSDPTAPITSSATCRAHSTALRVKMLCTHSHSALAQCPSEKLKEPSKTL